MIYSCFRISSQEQFNDICEIDYEQNGQADKLKCILYLHFGALDSERVKQFRQWGASKQAEFKDYARMVIISADQNPQFGKYFGGDSAVFVLKRYKNNIARVKMILHEGKVSQIWSLIIVILKTLKPVFNLTERFWKFIHWSCMESNI